MATTPLDVHSNLVVSSVATAPVTPTAGTSLIVTAGQGTRFPDPATFGPYNVSIMPVNQSYPDLTTAEIVRVTAKSTDTLTITRAQEGTTARSVIATDKIAMTITAKTVTDIEARINGSGLWYNVANNQYANLVGDDATDNTAGWATLFAALPVGANVFFPPGTYRGNFIISGDKHLHIKGAGRQQSIIRANHALGDPSAFHINGEYWFNTFEDLGFASTSTTSSVTFGIKIDPGASGNAVGTNIRACDFYGLGTAISAVGIGAANVSTWSDITIGIPATITPNPRGLVINGANINMSIDKVTINMNPGSTAPTGSACVEINAVGALQVELCDWIGGINTLLLNASGTNLGIAAAQFTNCFMDQSGGSTVKFTGSAGNISRINFTQCGITGGNVAGATAVEIAATGTGAAGTATAQPDGIDFLNCNIYPNGGSGTQNGFLITGAQGVTIAACRISGWTNGVQVTPSLSAGYTKIFIKDNKMGATNNFTTPNTVGVLLNVGSFTYGAVQIVDNDFSGSTMPITDNSAVVSTAQKNIAGNIGLVMGKVRASSATGITTITQVDNIALPAGCLRVGTAIRITGWFNRATGDLTATTINVTAGTAGTTADGTVCALVPTHTSVANQGGRFEVVVVCRAIGAGSTSLVGTGLVALYTNGTSIATTPVGNYSRHLGNALATLTHTNAMFLGVNIAHATNAVSVDNLSFEVLQQ